MARYNPKNKQHRKSLATRIAKMLVAAGFSLDASSKGEAVYERPVDGELADRPGFAQGGWGPATNSGRRCH